MRRTLYLGKIDYNRRGRRVNGVDIEWELTDDGRFTASGNIWNGSHGDILAGGQILEEIARLFPRDYRVRRIVEVWRRWHLNDLQAGTPKQQQAIARWRAKGNKYDYTKACEYLKSIGLYEDDGYKYGHGWLKKGVPPEVINEIRSWSQFPQGELESGEYPVAFPSRTRRKSKPKRKRKSSSVSSLRGLR